MFVEVNKFVVMFDFVGLLFLDYDDRFGGMFENDSKVYGGIKNIGFLGFLEIK